MTCTEKVLSLSCHFALYDSELETFVSCFVCFFQSALYEKAKRWLFFCSAAYFKGPQCRAELAGDVPTACEFGHRDALSAVTDGKTKARLSDGPLCSDPLSVGALCGLSLPLLVEKPQAGVLLVATVD